MADNKKVAIQKELKDLVAKRNQVFRDMQNEEVKELKTIFDLLLQPLEDIEKALASTEISQDKLKELRSKYGPGKITGKAVEFFADRINKRVARNLNLYMKQLSEEFDKLSKEFD